MKEELETYEAEKKAILDKLKAAKHTVWLLEQVDLKAVEKKIERIKELMK